MPSQTGPNFVYEDITIAVIGLGYVGLPLATEFGKIFETIGYDVKQSRIDELKSGQDSTLEVEEGCLKEATKLRFSAESENLKDANVYIVTVPTPIDASKTPDLSPLRSASQVVGKYISTGDLVIYESTVYPGATEEECVPILESESGLMFNHDFFVGYSPERINPGDKQHRLTSILKVVSGSTSKTAEVVDRLYSSIVTAGTYRTSSIQVAEAAKVIENTQRDLNISLINELSIIFRRLNIDTEEVLKAAGTKWNFLPFKPGLVGGHCIGVDPYYLTYKAQQVGYEPNVILAGRRINDGMGRYVAGELVKAMLAKRIHVSDANVLVMGLTFKENCPDIRNTKVIDVVSELHEYGAKVDVCDPQASVEEAKTAYGIELISPKGKSYDALILAVAHREFVEAGVGVTQYLKESHVIFDLKHCLPPEVADIRL